MYVFVVSDFIFLLLIEKTLTESQHGQMLLQFHNKTQLLELWFQDKWFPAML